MFNLSNAAKRIYLNIGLILLLFALYSFVNITIGNARLYTVTGTVIGPGEETALGYPMIEYTLNGETYQRVGDIAIGLSKTESKQLTVGAQAEFYVNRYNYNIIDPIGYKLVFIFLIPALILTAVFRRGFIGYITDFIAPNKASFLIMTGSHVLCIFLAAVQTHKLYSSDKGIEWMVYTALWLIVIAANFLTWIVYNIIIFKKTKAYLKKMQA